MAFRLDPFKRIIGFSAGAPGPWTMSVLLRVPGSTRMMNGDVTGIWSDSGTAIADDGVQFTHEWSGSAHSGDYGNWWYDIDDHPGFGERFIIEVTVLLQLVANPDGNYFLAQLNADNYPADSPHGGGIIVNTITREINIDGQHIPGISVPPI